MERGDSSRNYSRHIPDLVSVVQAALARREHGKSPKDNRIDDTQEYVRRAIKEPIEDDTFQNNPWLKVVNYGHLDMEEYTSIATILSYNGLGLPLSCCGYFRKHKSH